MICDCKLLCKQAIVDWCRNNRSELDKYFVRPLTDSEFNDAINIENWLTLSERMTKEEFEEDQYSDLDYCFKAWSFDCEPFDDQLRAYVKVKNGNIVDILVQGE